MRCRRSELQILAAAVGLLVGFEATAAVRRFDMITDAASNSEGEIELEGWLDFGRPKATTSGSTNGMAWLGARFGLLDSLELAGFLVLEKSEVAEGNPGDDISGLMMWVTELRWRPVEVGKWPIDLFIQGQVMHWFEPNHPTQFRVTLGVSKMLSRVLLAANASFWTSTSFRKVTSLPTDPDIMWNWLDLSLGASVNVIEADGSVPSVSVGVEAWWLIKAFTPDVHSHLLNGGGLVVGPTLALARGRLWITGHLGIPAYLPAASMSIKPLVGRVMLGINL